MIVDSVRKEMAFDLKLKKEAASPGTGGGCSRKPDCEQQS